MAVNLQALNAEQRKAVMTTEGPVMVLAGAGTGKTMVITSRIAHIVEKGLAKETQILAVTFTNKAANEMRERVMRLLGKGEVRGLWVNTFHAFCMKLLRQHGMRIGYGRDFTIIDRGDQMGIIKQALAQLGLVEDEESKDADAILGEISRAKNHDRLPGDLQESADPWLQRTGRIYEYYQDYLRALNLVDFDDLLQQSVALLRDHPEVQAEYHAKFKYVMVDEFQDTNAIQMDLLRLLVPPSRNVCVVGDDDQSIYSWRGAEVKNILEFHHQYKGTELIKLEQNYRSTDIILQAANRVIAINSQRHAKALWSPRKEGDKIRMSRCEDEYAEAQLACRFLRAHNTLGRRWQDMAILYRSNHQSRALEELLRRHAIPYRVVGDSSFYERKEVKDALAYLSAAVNPQNDFAFLRILDSPPRGVGATTVKRLREEASVRGCSCLSLAGDPQFTAELGHAGTALRQFQALVIKHRSRILQAEPGRVSRRWREYLDEVDYLNGIARMYRGANPEERYENVMELLASLEEAEAKAGAEEPLTAQSFLASVTLAEDFRRREEKEEASNAVSLMTMHASKGLEFGVVLLVGMEEKLFPHERSVGLAAVAEERRLYYVAITRAKEILVLLHCANRSSRARKEPRKISPFLNELPAEYAERVSHDELIPKSNSTDFASLLRAFAERGKSTTG